MGGVYADFDPLRLCHCLLIPLTFVLIQSVVRGRLSRVDRQRKIEEEEKSKIPVAVSPRNPWFRGSSRANPSPSAPERSSSPGRTTSPLSSPLSAAVGATLALKRLSSAAQLSSMRKINSVLDGAPNAGSNVMAGVLYVEYVSSLCCNPPATARPTSGGAFILFAALMSAHVLDSCWGKSPSDVTAKYRASISSFRMNKTRKR